MATKKRTTFLLFLTLVLSINLVASAEIYELRDLTQESPQFVGLYPKDFVRFNYFNATHIIQIEKVLSEQEVNVIVFPYGQNGTYLTIGGRRSLKLDLDRDLNDDIEINVFDVELEENVTVLRFDNLQTNTQEQNNDVIVLPEEFTQNTPTGSAVIKEQKIANPAIGIVIIAIAIIFGVIIANVIKKQKK